jgi:hypothetical protein
VGQLQRHRPHLSLIVLGAWFIHIFLIAGAKLFFSSIPGISSEASWTLTVLAYNIGSYIAFHWAMGVPFDLAQGAYNSLTFWEQMDNGEPFTPTKKFLTLLPVALFLLSVHYSHYDLISFLINFVSTAVVLVAKQPVMHKVRLFGINKGYTSETN